MTGRGPDKRTMLRSRSWSSAFRWLGYRVSLKVIIASFAVIGVAIVTFLVVGGVNVSADKPDGWLSRHLLHFVFNRSIASRSAGVVPPDDLMAASRVRLAAQHFDMVCSNCHGRPGFGQSVVALSMNPRPQYLPKVVGQFTDSELYGIVEHGVKYSAMPSWPTDTRGDEVWSMVAFLRQLPTLDAKSYHDMAALPVTKGVPPVGASTDVILRRGDTRREEPPFDEFAYEAPTAGFADETVHVNPVATCARCHGDDGSGAVTGGEAPNLTIQDATYLRAALEDYTRGSRRSGFMQNIAAQLSGAQITALAEYYSGLPVRAPPSPPHDPALIERGERIALLGIPKFATPACSTCHDSNGGKVSGAPHLAGQSSKFIFRQLSAMSRGGRGSTNWWNPMPAVAHSLDKADIAAVASYYSTLRPTKTTDGAQPAENPPPPLLPRAKIDNAAARGIFETRCIKCHVNDGRGDQKGDYPDLTLQSTPFLAQSLYAFRSGARPSDKMRQVTGDLSLDQIASLAAYVNHLTAQPALPKPDLAAAARGASIAIHGVPARGVPACLGCHGASGVADLPLIPRLQGQSAPYLRARLNMFAQPNAKNLSALNPMPLIAGRLTDRQSDDLAAYFAAAAPLQKAPSRP